MLFLLEFYNGIKKDETHQIVLFGILIGKTRCVPDRAFLLPNCIVLKLDTPFCTNSSFHFVVNWRRTCNLYEMDVGSPELYLKKVNFPRLPWYFKGDIFYNVCCFVLNCFFRRLRRRNVLKFSLRCGGFHRCKLIATINYKFLHFFWFVSKKKEEFCTTCFFFRSSWRPQRKSRRSKRTRSGGSGPNLSFFFLIQILVVVVNPISNDPFWWCFRILVDPRPTALQDCFTVFQLTCDTVWHCVTLCDTVWYVDVRWCTL